ncbi:hypothetical protein LSH36_248g03027 [Paralvinella palmiformis]|uniref:Uncharacterized protein n=1 Tax=Paralvinella palmiformis TaxID=53620 RepID=A0AAD9JMC8_9ANNE|nr:hypothetical protein LSH36_248g03027 [Paralvinella palmiformis]
MLLQTEVTCRSDGDATKLPVVGVCESVTDIQKCYVHGVKSTDQNGPGLGSELIKADPVLNRSKTTSNKITDNCELNLLTENLLSLNEDSAHLNTVIHQKPTPKKKKMHPKHRKVHSHVTPLKLLTPRKSPWKSFSLRVTPHRHSTPSSSCQTPRSTPGSTTGSIADLHTPKSTPHSAKSEKKYSVTKRTPSKVSIKRRLYAAMRSPEKIIDENEDVANLSFPDMSR